MAEFSGVASLGQISRMVRDIDEATTFYRDVLGLDHLYSFGELAFFDLAGTRLYLHETKQPGAESVLYFRVHDLALAQSALEAKGVVFSAGSHMVHRHSDGTEEWLAFFSDPEGRALALIAQVRHG
ncbi:MAG: VOC family protein [Phyllobacteriaceae bacterium]|nr:VOC family protein [Phyllobacteriaceae bacterium]